MDDKLCMENNVSLLNQAGVSTRIKAGTNFLSQAHPSVHVANGLKGVQSSVHDGGNQTFLSSSGLSDLSIRNTIQNMINHAVNKALKVHGLATPVNPQSPPTDDCHICLFHTFMNFHEV